MLVPSSGGVHEVTYGGRLLHSKQVTRRHPDPRDVIAKIQAIVDGTDDTEPA